MGMEHRRLILGVELRTNVPLQRWDLNNLHEITLGIAAYTHHTVTFKLFFVVVVELVAVTVAL